MNTVFIKNISITGADESVITAQIHRHIDAGHLVPVVYDGEQISAYTEENVLVYGYYSKHVYNKDGETPEEYRFRKSKENPEYVVWYDYKFVPQIETSNEKIIDASQHKTSTIYAIIFTPSIEFITGCGYLGFARIFQAALQDKFVSLLENSKSYRIKNPYYTDTKFKNVLEIEVKNISSIEKFKQTVIKGMKKNLPYKSLQKIFNCSMSEKTYHAAIDSMFEYCSYSGPSREYDWDVYELVTKSQRFLPNVANLAAKDLSMRFIQQYLRNVLTQSKHVTLKTCTKSKDSNAIKIKFHVKAGTDVAVLLRELEVYDFFIRGHIHKAYSE